MRDRLNEYPVDPFFEVRLITATQGQGAILVSDTAGPDVNMILECTTVLCNAYCVALPGSSYVALLASLKAKLVRVQVELRLGYSESYLYSINYT